MSNDPKEVALALYNKVKRAKTDRATILFGLAAKYGELRPCSDDKADVVTPVKLETLEDYEREIEKLMDDITRMNKSIADYKERELEENSAAIRRFNDLGERFDRMMNA